MQSILANMRILITGLFWFIISLGMITQIARAQSPQVAAEFPYDKDLDRFKVIPLGQNGVAIINLTAIETQPGKMAFMVSSLDTSLKSKWITQVPFIRGDKLLEVKTSQGRIILFFQNEEKTTQRLISIHENNGVYETAQFNTVDPLVFSDIEVANNNFIISGLLNKHGVLLSYRIGDERYKSLPSSFSSFVYGIEQIQFSQEQNVLSYLMRIKNNKRYTYVIRRLGLETDRFEDVLLPNARYNLGGAEVKYTADKALVVAQYYRTDITNSEGIYIATFDGTNVATVSSPWNEILGNAQIVEADNFDQKFEALDSKKLGFDLVLLEEPNIYEDKVLITLEVFRKRFRSRNVTEREFEKERRLAELNGRDPSRFFLTSPDGVGLSNFYSNTELLEARYMDFALSRLVSDGLEYSFTSNLEFDADLAIKEVVSVHFPAQTNSGVVNGRNTSTESSEVCYYFSHQIACVQRQGQTYMLGVDNISFELVEQFNYSHDGSYLLAGPALTQGKFRIEYKPAVVNSP